MEGVVPYLYSVDAVDLFELWMLQVDSETYRLQVFRAAWAYGDFVFIPETILSQKLINCNFMQTQKLGCLRKMQPLWEILCNTLGVLSMSLSVNHQHHEHCHLHLNISSLIILY
jgi:hypothetical protein